MAAELTATRRADAPGPPSAGAPAPKLRLVGLSKRFGAVRAVDDVTLDVQSGEFLTLLGPSGSGKSTLLTMIAGLSMPSSGEVWIGGESATYRRPHERDIGMVFQNYALFPHMTVAENVGFPLAMRRVRSAEVRERVREALDLVHLAHVADRVPRQLSGGQQQRVALARSLVYKPSVLLMDEPLGALDKKLREHVQFELKALQTDLRITVVYVTHDQDEALTMSDRICLLRDGRIEQLGTPHELYTAPRSHFVADFLGESNFFEGTVVRGDGIVEVALSTGVTVHASSRLGERSGDRVLVMMRPEVLRFVDGPSHGNRLAGRIEDATFMGAVMRYVVSVGGEKDVVVKETVQNAMPRRTAGDLVTIGWRSEDCVLLRTDEGA